MRIVFDVWCQASDPRFAPFTVGRTHCGTVHTRERAEERASQLRTMLAGSLAKYTVGYEERTEYLAE